jgi:SAM-dependent methyltransferase
MTQERDYVLGTHDDEIHRLGLQHRVWRPRVLDAWRRAGFTLGQSLIDLGSGPGHATMDLAEIVGPGGQVLALERSRRFLDALQAMQRERGYDNIEAIEVDLDEVDGLPPYQGGIKGGRKSQADGAWCRWVLCFVKRPREILANIAELLRPGGTLVLHEYFDYATWRFAPPCPELEEFVAAVMQSWRAQGGEPDIALSIPRWLEELGFQIRSLQPIVEVVPPTSFVWHWPRSFVEVGLRRLVELDYFTPQRASEILAAVDAAEANPRTLMITPAVLEIIAMR